MDKTVYYFTGTGNSLAVARVIADSIRAELVSIPKVVKQDKIEIKTEVIGIVFPIYHQGLPLIVKKFVNKLKNLKHKYVFAICTYGDSPGISLKHLEDLIKKNNGKLSASFAVQMPYNYINPSLNIFNFFNSFQLREITQTKIKRLFNDFKLKQKEITKIILNKETSQIETEAEIIENLVDRLNLRNTLQKYIWLKVAGYQDKKGLSFQSSLKYMDHGFKVDESCNSCGNCKKVCPVTNIDLKDGRPSWQHRCEQCFACLQWCPQTAIQFREGTKGQKRYKHPDVSLSDIIDSNNIYN